MVEDAQAKLLTEQLGRMQDMILSRLKAIEERLEFHTKLDGEKHAALEVLLKDVKTDVDDHEQRIRAATEGVTTFKVWSGLAAGGSSLVAIVSLIKSFF